MKIFNDPSYSDFVLKVKEQIESEDYDELFKNCRRFLIKYDKENFNYFETIEERYHSKSEPIINIIDDLINFLDNITLVYNSDIYTIEKSQILAVILFLGILSYMFITVDLSIRTYTILRYNHKSFEYLPVKINTTDLVINEIVNVNMDSNIDDLKSDIVMKMAYTDTSKTNIEHHKSTILIDGEFTPYSLGTSIKSLFYIGKIKNMSTITLVNIDSLPRFSYPQIFEDEKNDLYDIQDISFKPSFLDYQVYFDFHYMIASENRKTRYYDVFALIERYEHIIERETESNIKSFLINDSV